MLPRKVRLLYHGYCIYVHASNIALGAVVANLIRAVLEILECGGIAERSSTRESRVLPEAKLEEPSPDPKVKRHLVDNTAGYLTKGEFLELYGRTSDILHERNP